jgi:inosine triphosphate pyrophosphatase
MDDIKVIASGKLDFRMQAIDLPEIQSLDLREIVSDKLRRAYEQVKAPVIVDDVSAGLSSLKGLPGPFIKFFEKKLGQDALFQLASDKADKVTVHCTAGYYDGQHMLYGEGALEGTVVSRRGSNGFGFDVVVVPDGQTKTMAEMTQAQKLSINHRSKAFQSLFKQIETL